MKCGKLRHTITTNCTQVLHGEDVVSEKARKGIANFRAHIHGLFPVKYFVVHGGAFRCELQNLFLITSLNGHAGSQLCSTRKTATKPDSITTRWANVRRHTQLLLQLPVSMHACALACLCVYMPTHPHPLQPCVSMYACPLACLHPPASATSCADACLCTYMLTHPHAIPPIRLPFTYRKNNAPQHLRLRIRQTWTTELECTQVRQPQP